MVKNIVVAILFSLICNSIALDTTFSPVLFFRHKENTRSFAKIAISSTTQVDQSDFERRFETFGDDQQIFIFVAPDLSPEDFSTKDEQNVRAFQNMASELKVLEYIPFVENPTDNKVTNGKNVAHASVSAINDLQPEPSADSKIIVVKLDECDSTEFRFHCLSRYDRIMYAISHSEKYKNALFILSSEKNSRLEQHSRQRRETPDAPTKHSDANALVYFKGVFERSKKEHTDDKPIKLSVFGTDAKENEVTVHLTGAYTIDLIFQYDPYTEHWGLNSAISKINNKTLSDSRIGTRIGAPRDFSFSCTSSASFYLENDTEVEFVYFQNLQIQFDFNNNGQQSAKFRDSYDCTGFTSPAIWAGLFITFLLLFILSTAITYIMDIRTMDRFDDPKGKTITITASD